MLFTGFPHPDDSASPDVLSRCIASVNDLMARPIRGGRTTCESCAWIDVRQWHRQGRLHAGQQFSWSWTRGRDAAGSITVRVEDAAVVLSYRSCRPGSDEWKSIQQRVPINLTAVNALGFSVRSIATVAIADAEPLSFTALASYLPADGAMACPMRANSRRRCIAAWGKRERSG